jgi:lipopolysaccharide export system permease protein
MKTLDRYILLQFLKTFLIINLSFAALFIIIDVFDRLPRILNFTSDINLLIQYFVLRIPYLFVITSPVTILLSGLFLMDMLSKYNESIAVRASGVSIVRLITPVIIFALAYSLFIMLFGDLALPKAEDYREHLYRVEIRGQEREDVRMRSNIQYRGEGNILYNIGFFDGFRKTLRMIDITTFAEHEHLITRKLTATNASWENDEWVFQNCVIRTFDNGVLASANYYQSISLDDINVTPEDFVKSAKSPFSMNYFELSSYIERLKRIGENFNNELVDLHLKVSFPFANLIIILFCVPLVTVSVRSKYRGMIFLVGITICFIYLTILRISQSLGYNEVLSPVMAAWLPNIIFGLVGMVFVVKAEV